MKRLIAVTVLLLVLSSVLLSVTEAPVSDADLAQRPSRDESREYQWYNYADVSEMSNLNWPVPERGTLFQMTADFGLSYPVTIRQVGLYFYQHSSYIWPDSTFTLKIYGADGSTILYQSTLEAVPYPTETMHTFMLPLIMQDDFYIVVAPVDASGHPSSLTANRGTGNTIHTYVGEAGSWTPYDTGTAAYEMITRVYADAPEAATGGVQGYVYAYNTTTPLENALVELGNGQTYTTSATGFYEFTDVYVGSYDMLCNPPDGSIYFEDSATVEILENQVEDQNFYLQWAEIAVNPTTVAVELNPENTQAQAVRITNDGPATLEYHAYLNFFAPTRSFDPNASTTTARLNTSPRNDTTPTVTSNPTLTREAGDVVFSLDASTPTGEAQLLGVEYAGGYFWATGAGNDADPNYIYKLDTAGNLIASYEQNAEYTGWGLRDLAYDGTYLYAGNETYFVQIDPATGVQTNLFTFTAAEFGGVTCIRALAYVPGSGFYTKSFSSDIVRFDAAGNVLEVIDSPGADAAYGMAYNPVSGNLWCFDQSGDPATTFIEIDPSTGTLTGNSYVAPLVGGCTEQMAGGMTFSSDLIYGKLVLVGMTQGTPVDCIFALELEATETWVSITSNAQGSVSGYARDYVDLMLEFSSVGMTGGESNAGELVIIHNADATGTYTIPLSLDVLGGQLDAPLDIDIEEIDGDMHISWQAVTNATQYNIYRSSLPDDGFAPYDTTTNTEYIDSAPGADKYFYRVTAE